MKLAIWSDLHVGHRMYRTDENNYNKFEQIGYRALQENVDIIKAGAPDLLINAGDTFETANPSVLAMTHYFNAMQQLSHIPSLTILGNHDFNFANKKNGCSAVGMASHTYFADYDIKTVEIDDILFVMMPYVYDSKDNIASYLNKCKKVAVESSSPKKILVTHGITERYSKSSLITDPIMLPDYLVELFDLVIIGHIHTPYSYKQNKTLVISPGSMIDYQAYEDRTGPIFLDTDTMDWNKIKVKTPHIIKKKCDADSINKLLANVTEDIYHVTFTGDVDAIDNDLFIKAKNIAVNLVIDVVQKEDEEPEHTETSEHIPDLFEWVNKNYPDFSATFNDAREVVMCE